MTKIEMAKKVYDMSDENGNVKLEDFAKLVFQEDSPQEVVDTFLKHANELKEAENLWNEVGRISKAITEKQTELDELNKEFSNKYEKLKDITREIGMDKYLKLP